MRFIRKIKGVYYVSQTSNTAIRESLDIESLLLRIESSQQLIWFGHVSKMPRERLPKQIYMLKWMGRDQLDGHNQNGLINVENASWNRLGFHPSDMQSVLVDQKEWPLIVQNCSSKLLKVIVQSFV